MSSPIRPAFLLAIPVVVVLGGVAFVGACNAPLPTGPTEQATTPAPEPVPAVSSSEQPPAPPSLDRQASEPAFTPMTVRPVLENTTRVREVLLAEYPALLRDAGIGGTSVLWIHIPTSGAVDDARVFESSGFAALDEAALNVARAMVFTPAMNGDQVTDTWVQLPIRFTPVS